MLFLILFISGVSLFYSFNYFPFTSGFIFLSAITALFFRKKYLLIPIIALGIFYAFLRHMPESDFSELRGKEMFISGAFVSEAFQTSSGRFIQPFHTDSAIEPDTKEPIAEIVDKDINIISDSEFEIGRGYEITVKLSKDTTRLTPGVMKNDNLYANLIEVGDSNAGKRTFKTIFENARASLDKYVTKNFNADSGALISAITTGRRVNMSEELRNAFNSSGLAHILSIAGVHFGFFSVIIFGLFRVLIKYLPYRILQRITIYITPSQAAALLSLPFMFAYLALSGWHIPAIRSFVMIGLFLIGLLIGRKGFWLNSLLFAALVIILWNPEALFTIPFQLSFLAVLFIGFSIGGYKKEDRDTDSNRIFKFMKGAVLLTLAASLGTAPLVAYSFHYFSLISPIANLIITPLIGFALLPLALFSSFIFLLTGYYPFAVLVKAVANLSVYLVRHAGGLPFADIKIPAFSVFAVILFYVGCLLYFIFRKDENNKGKFRYFLNRKLLIIIPSLLLVCLILPFFRGKQNISVAYLDVGQGDSEVVNTPGGLTMVIDTGKTGKELDSYLRYCGKNTIDALIITHADDDHCRGAPHIIKMFKVKEVWDNGLLIYPDGLLKNAIRRSLERGDEITSGDFRILALHPYKGFYTLAGGEEVEENNDSLVVKIEGEKSFLFTGDIAEEAEDDLEHLGAWLKSDVLKVAHHGSRTSSKEDFLRAVSPEIAVISVGRDNSYGHPHRETLERLGESATKIYRTDRDGAVKVTEKENRLEVKTFKDFQFEKTRSFGGEIRNWKRLFEVW